MMISRIVMIIRYNVNAKIYLFFIIIQFKFKLWVDSESD